MENKNNPPGAEENLEPKQAQSKTGQNIIPFSEALTEIVKNLKGQPLLLFALGAAIVLLGAGVWGLENLRPLIGSLLILLIVGIAAWVFLETRKIQHAGTSGSKVASGDVIIDREVKAKKVDVESGGIKLKHEVGEVGTGNIKIKSRAELKDVKIKSGGVNIGETNTPDTDE